MLRNLLAALAVTVTLSTPFLASSAWNASPPEPAAREASPLAHDRAAALRRMHDDMAHEAKALEHRLSAHLQTLTEAHQERQAELDRISDLVPQEYRPLVIETAARYGLSPRLVAAVGWVESRWDPRAEGRDGEIGIMQIMPATARWIAAQMGLERYDLYDPATNVAMGSWYLAVLLKESGGDVDEALRRYNAGGAWETRAPRAARQYVSQVRDAKQNGG